MESDSISSFINRSLGKSFISASQKRYSTRIGEGQYNQDLLVGWMVA